MKNELNKLNLEKHRLHENFHNCSYKSIVNEKEDCVIFMRKKVIVYRLPFGEKIYFCILQNGIVIIVDFHYIKQNYIF
jgi:hypothetical protein